MPKYYLITYSWARLGMVQPIKCNAISDMHPVEWLINMQKIGAASGERHVLEFFVEISEEHYHAANDLIN